MPWLISLLPTVANWAIHSGARFISVLAVGIVLIGGPLLIYRHAVGVGFKQGYNQALKDHPQNVYNGASTIIQQKPAAIYGLKIGSHWGFGIVHE